MPRIFVISNNDSTSSENLDISYEFRQTQDSKNGKRQNNQSPVERIPGNIVSDNENGRTIAIDESSNNFSSPIELERISHQEKEKKRKELFVSYIWNDTFEFSWKECVIYTVGIVLYAVIVALPITLIPMHNLVKDPEYWYELLLFAVFFYTFSTLNQCMEISFGLNMRYFRKKRYILQTIILQIAIVFITIIAAHAIWTIVYELHFPIPFFGIMIVYWMKILLSIIQWYTVPKMYHQDNQLKKRMKVFFFEQFIYWIIIAIYQITIQVIRDADSQYQPLLALALPLQREMLIWITSKITKRCADGDVTGALIFKKYVCLVAHATVLCFVIGTYATRTTGWILMTVDFAINILGCLRLVHKKMNEYN